MKNFDNIFSRVDNSKLPTPEHPSVNPRRINRRIAEVNSSILQCRKLLNSIYNSHKKNV